MGMSQKVLLMSTLNAAGGFAGASGAAAGGAAALGVAAASTAVVSRHSATTEQKATALRIARKAESRKSSGRARYIAVRTTRTSRSSSENRSSSQPTSTPPTRGAASVMIYDTQTDSLATDQVFEINKKPREGSFVEFDTFYTEYVGDGVGGPSPGPREVPKKKVQDKSAGE